MYGFAKSVVHIVLSVFGRINIYEKQELPKSGGYVIACTHTGWVDILWLAISVYPTRLHFMAKKELFQNKLIKWLLTKLNAFPVNRENPGPSAIKIPKKLISEGKVIGIFPSGTRTSEEVPLKRGAVTIAVSSNVPIVPAAYVGPNNFHDLVKRKRPMIMFGKPINVEDDLSKKEKMDVMMRQLEESMKELQLQLEENKC